MSKFVCEDYSKGKGLINVLRLLTKTVLTTFGPDGKVVVIDQGKGNVPLVTKDGVTVSESVHSDDPFEEMLLDLLKESSRKTAIEEGDGTTTSMLLAVKLIGGLVSETVTKEVIEGMMNAINFVYQQLEDQRIDCSDLKSALLSVINISCNGDKNIVKLLTEVVSEVGAEGIIDVKLVESQDTTVVYNDGATMKSAAEINPDKKTGLWERMKPAVLLIEGKLEFSHQIIPILKSIYKPQEAVAPLIIIAQEFSDEVKHTINVNNGRGKSDIAMVDSEGFGKSRMNILEDIELLTDAVILSTDGSTSVRLMDYTNASLGKLERAIVSPIESTLYPAEDINIAQRHIREEELKDLYKDLRAGSVPEGAAERVNLERHLSKFVKVATVFVGGFTEAEAKERYDRVDDAVCAVVSAHNGGVLPGGGSSLFRASVALREVAGKDSMPYTGDYKLGVDAIVNMCCEPIIALGKSADIEDMHTQLLALIMRGNAIDFSIGKTGDALSMGIIDPYNVTIAALHNALSVSKTVLRSSAFIMSNRE